MSRIHWARVDYQRDLRRAGDPVPLGIVLFYRSPEMRGLVVMGREPRPGVRPPEPLADAGTLGVAQLEGWVMSLARDAGQAAQSSDPFSELLTRWRWNVSVRDPEPLDSPEFKGAFRPSLLRIAQRLYNKHVGEPFPILGLAPSAPPRSAARKRARSWVSREVESLVH